MMEKDIQKVIDTEINPVLGLHKGSCELVSLEDNTLTVRLNGGCAGCPSAKLTMLNGVAPIIMENFPEIEDIILDV